LTSPRVPGFPEYRILAIPEFQHKLTREDLKDIDQSERTLNILRQVFCEEPELEELSSDLTHEEFRKDWNVIHDLLDPILLDHFHKTQMTHLPILKDRRMSYFFVKSGNIRWIRKRIIDHTVLCLLHASKNPQFEDFGDGLLSQTLEDLRDMDDLCACKDLFEPGFKICPEQKFLPYEGFENLLDSDFTERTRSPKLFPHDQLEECWRFDLPEGTVRVDHPKNLPQ
jgi:hypothetical protein